MSTAIDQDAINGSNYLWLDLLSRADRERLSGFLNWGNEHMMGLRVFPNAPGGREHPMLGLKDRVAVPMQPILPGQHVSGIPAGLPHHLTADYGWWHINDVDEIYVPVPIEGDNIALLLLEALTPERHDQFVWYCPRCYAHLYGEKVHTGKLGIEGYWQAERRAVDTFNSDAALRRCKECSAEHPAAYSFHDPYELKVWWQEKRAVGKFSTDKKFLMNDEIGRFETGRTLSPNKFLTELLDTYVYPVQEYIKKDPLLELMASGQCTDEQFFKILAMFWNFERSVGQLHGTWLLGYKIGAKGEYQEVEYLEIRQIYEEYKHARMYEDAILNLGYLDKRSEMFAHPFCQFSPEALALHTFLQRLGTFPIPVRAAANHLASEDPLIPWFEIAGQTASNPEVAGVFEAQIIEERGHANIGEYVVSKYADTSEVQAQARWACSMVKDLTARFVKTFNDWVMTPEADQLETEKTYWARKKAGELVTA